MPYAYAPRHFGHLAGAYLPADIYVRYRRLVGDQVLFVCGTDENAASIILEAQRQRITPQELCDRYHPQQEDTFRRLGISFDIFSRTSYDIHHETVTEFYKTLWQKGFIEPREIKQLYCPRCHKVLPDRFVKGICPICNTPDQYGESCENCANWYEAYELLEPKCTICGSEPDVIDSIHFFLLLSKLNQSVLEYVRTKKDWRKATYAKTISWLETDGLRDRDITRDYDWGPKAPFPGSKGQVIYNWAENLLGYISATKHWAIEQGEPGSWKEYWDSEDTNLLCFIAKDNLFFHTILFPALLHAHGDYNQPKNVVMNQFVNLKGKKFSTSRGWVIHLHEMLEKYDPDLIRFYAAINAPETKDTDFTWSDFQIKVNNELIATFGNFVHRSLVFAYNHFDRSIPYIDGLREQDETMLFNVYEIVDELKTYLERTEFQSGLKALLRIAQTGNRYLNSEKPWNNSETAAYSIYTALQIVHILSIIITPYLPFTAERIRNILGNRTPYCDLQWTDIKTKISPGAKITEPRALYRKLTDEEINSEINML